MTSIKTLATATLLVVATLSAPAFAADEYNTSSGLTAAGSPLGLHGVDPVAFINLGNRIDGTAKFTAVHDGVAYYFASQEAVDAFAAHPDTYLPQNGGFCTFGVSVGKKFDGDPQFAAIVNDKLYLFLNEDIFREFQKDPAGTITRADANWKKIRSTAAAAL